MQNSNIMQGDLLEVYCYWVQPEKYDCPAKTTKIIERSLQVKKTYSGFFI